MKGHRGCRGVTLVEVLLAAAILGVIAVALGGSVRVALRAWEAGDRQAARQQEIRALAELLGEALASAFPYRGRLGQASERVVLFQGEPESVRFVTMAPPLTLDTAHVAFHAVIVGRSGDDTLHVVERPVPAQEPFGDGPRTILSRAVVALRLEYLDDKGSWQERWDGPAVAALPAAVRVELELSVQGRRAGMPALVVPLPLGRGGA